MHLWQARCAPNPGEQPGWIEVKEGLFRSTVFGAERLKQDLISRLDFVASVKGQGCAPRPMRMPADPGIFVGESPGLNRRTARILHARPHHAPVNVSLP